MGDLKVQRYGQMLLDALRPHADRLCAEHEEEVAARGALANDLANLPPLVAVQDEA